MADILQSLIDQGIQTINRLNPMTYVRKGSEAVGNMFLEQAYHKRDMEEAAYLRNLTRSQDIQDRDYENFYNSPAEQAKRFEAAGLNPALLVKGYESSSFTNSPGSLPFGNMPQFPKITDDSNAFNPQIQEAITNELNNQYLQKRNKLVEQTITTQKLTNKDKQRTMDILDGKRKGRLATDPIPEKLKILEYGLNKLDDKQLDEEMKQLRDFVFGDLFK